MTTSCRGETSKTHLSPASPIVVYLLCADKCDRSLQSCLGLTFPLCCFDHIACWFPRNTRLCTKNRVIKITGTGSVSCNSVFVLHLCRFLNQEDLMEREAIVQNP